MTIPLPIREGAAYVDLDSWLADLRLRYGRLLVSCRYGVEAKALVRLAVKLSELTELARADAICRRDAGLLPLLAGHVQAQFNALEGASVAQAVSAAPVAPRRAA